MAQSQNVDDLSSTQCLVQMSRVWYKTTSRPSESPSYLGAQSLCHPSTNKSKAYYHATYPEPPGKSVLHDIIEKLLKAMAMKNMPFSFLVVDLPTYKTVVKLMAEPRYGYKLLSTNKCHTYMLFTKGSKDPVLQTFWWQQEQ